MNELERLALAGLVHDLPDVLGGTRMSLPAENHPVLKLAKLDGTLKVILDQAEVYAMPGNTDGRLVTDAALISIFSRIQLQPGPEPAPQYHQIGSLPSTEEAQDTLFPVPESDVSRLPDHLQALGAEVDWLASNVDLTRFDRAYPHLMALLGRFAWCLPVHSQDVALLDHAKLTSAIAACLYLYHQADLSAEAVEAAAQTERFCLLVGDLSGIQDYIFDITTIGAGGVARRLRARSFYLSALSDVLSYQIAQRFGVPLGNEIMASGGKFYLLLPNRADVESEIDALRRQVDTWLREAFNGEIAINLAHIGLAGGQFRAGGPGQDGFGEVLTELSLRLNREKRQRGRGALQVETGWNESAFMISERDFEGFGACISCGKFPGDQAENLCVQCDRDVEEGKRLPRARYVAYYRQPAGHRAIPMPLDWSVRVLAGDELDQAEGAYLVTKLNDPSIHELAGYPASFRYLANHVPRNAKGGQASFEDIAEMAKGRSLLGYLKADVDYLGILFAQGLRGDAGGCDTAAHVAAFSRQLDVFFSGWIQHTLSKTSDYQEGWTSQDWLRLGRKKA